MKEIISVSLQIQELSKKIEKSWVGKQEKKKRKFKANILEQHETYSSGVFMCENDLNLKSKTEE